MTFRVAFGLALAMVIIAAIQQRISAGYFAMVLLYLLLSAFAPWLTVPLGVVVVIGLVVLSGDGNKLADWVGGFKA